MSTADSLILADVVELLGGGVISAHPLCPGAQITLVGVDFGSPQPQTEIVASLLLDGERPSGRRASNRTISLPIQIRGPSRPIMDGARELLQQLTDADTWRLTWTPDPQGGTALPMIFDCFRATAVVSRDLVMEDQLVSQLTLTFPALPFGRSDTLTTLVFPTPSVSFPTPPNPVRVDDFTTVSTTTQTTAGWWSQSSQHVLDSYSAHWDWSATDHDSGPFYTHALGSPVNITGLSKLTWQFGLGTDNYTKWHAGNVTFAVVLNDNSGHSLSFGGVAWCNASNNSLFPAWTQITFGIPTSAVFDYTNVASYSIRAWRFVDRDGALELDSDAYINGLTATASAQNPIAAVRGTLYQIAAPGGTARAPMSAQFQAPPVTVPTTTTFTTPGATTWTPPAGVTSVKVRVKGGGGIGGARSTTGQGGGAGGGANVAHDTYTVTPGQPIALTVGAAGATGGFPTLAASYYNSQDGRNTNSLVTPSFVPSAGEVLVVKAANEDGGGTFGTPSGGGLTFTSRVNVGGSAGLARAALWTAVVGGGGTAMTVTLPAGGTAVSHAMVVERWTGAKLAGSPAVTSTTGSGAPSATNTTAANNSIVSWVNADWNAVTGTHTYRSSAVEEQYTYLGGKYVAEWAYQQAAAAGAQTVGLTAPTGELWSIAGVEVQAFSTGALTDGQPSSFDGLAIVADGGKSVPVNTTTGGLGGQVANCVVPAGGTGYAGGNGANSGTTGGGGGSSAGDDVAGNNGSGVTGGAAPTGGAAGGNGGAAGANNGLPGSAPGGGGGGASSTGAGQTGGAGANGKVAITYTPPLAAFKTLVAHAPSYMAPPTLTPLIPVGAGVDPPDGREYTIASPVPGINARFYGTYTIVLFASTVNTPSAARTVTVTFKQYDYPGGPSTSLAVARTLTPNTETPPIANGMIIVGEITLPVRDLAADATSAYTTVAVNSTNSSDRFLDVLVLDVRGQTAAINVSSGNGHVNYYLDEPSIDRDWGRILASDYDRPQATSCLDMVAMLSGGPLMIDPAGAGWFMVYSADAGAPGLTATFYSRWRDSRLS